MLNQCLFILFDNIHKILEKYKQKNAFICSSSFNLGLSLWPEMPRNIKFSSCCVRRLLKKWTVCIIFLMGHYYGTFFTILKSVCLKFFFLGEIRTWWVLLRAWWHCVQFWRKIKNEKGHIRRLVSHTSSWGKRVIFTHCFTH